jgi:uncharacterized protein (TIGR02301 family)
MQDNLIVRIMTLATRILLTALTVLMITEPALAQKKEQAKPPAAAPAPPEKPAPYDQQLTRLAEILGSVHYLRTLCGAVGVDWRATMQKLLDTETQNEAARRERLTAAFNRGYRSFAAVHTTCTPTARVAEERYRAEGATLASEITARYGN